MFVPHYSDDGRRLTLTGSGRVLGSELLRTTEDLLGNEERIRKLRTVLILLDPIEALDAGAKDLRGVAELDRTLASWSKGLRIAVVARLPAAFGLGRMWEALVSSLGWEVMIMKTREEAEDWLERHP